MKLLNLREAGIEVVVAPLFKEWWFQILDLPQGLLRTVAKGLYSLTRFFVRIKDILKVGRYDFYCFEHPAFPCFPVF